MATTRLSGGKKLDAALKELSKKIDNAATLNVGFPEGSTESDGTPTPFVAAMNEFGHLAPGGNYFVLPRPFFRGMIAENSPHWGADLGKLLVATHYDARQSLELMGSEMEGELTESIQQLTDPPLAASTIAAKGFDKPLIHHGDMINAVDSFVE